MADEVVSCPHLKEFLKLLLRSGAEVVASDTGWTACKLNVVLSKGPTPKQAATMWRLPETIRLWSSDDPHYAIEHGLVCDACKVTLSWPQG